jgi:ATP/maltotriose-dependent transcriptional regulator MalT
MAGLVLFSSLHGDDDATDAFLREMREAAAILKNTKFQLYYRSIKARINWHRGLGNKEVEWAQTDWVNQTSASYFFLMDVPELTKIRIMVSHGSVLQVEEALYVLAEVKAHLDSVHNRYHDVDIELLKAMALLRVGRKELAKESLKNALLIAEKNNIIRPIMEAYRVMPSLLELVDQSVTSRRLLSRIGLKSSNNELPLVSYSKTDELSFREQQVIGLISTGLRNKEIADELNISTVTVKSHLTNIYRKLDVPNRTSMLSKARNMNILS